MVIGLRILALIIDAPLCFFSMPLVFEATAWILNHAGPLQILLIPFWFALFVAWPMLFFGVMTGLWGRTPGRWLCRLKVVDRMGETPGLWRGLGRETLKLLPIASGIGATICLIQIVLQGTTWYDQLCDTQVEYRPPRRMNATQKNFWKNYQR